MAEVYPEPPAAPPPDEPARAAEPPPGEPPLGAPAPTPALAPGPGLAPQPLSPQDERTWAMLAHLSVLLNLITGFLGPVGALAIYLIFKDRSRYVAFQSFQSFLNQLVWWVGGGLLAFVSFFAGTLLGFLIVPLLCIPLACLFGLAPIAGLAYGIWGGMETNQGKDFRYWLVGDWTRSMLNI